MEMSGQFHAPAALTPRERARGTHWIGRWVGARAGVDAVKERNINIISDSIFRKLLNRQAY
jgi:hypothetical protein